MKAIIASKWEENPQFTFRVILKVMYLLLNLNNYFNVCLSIRPSVRPFLSVQKLTSIPAALSHNITNKSCLCFEREKYEFGVNHRPLGSIECTGQS